MEYFNYREVADDAGISSLHLEKICQLEKSEFPHDQMMYELHVLRICMAIRDGLLDIPDLLHLQKAVSA